MDNDLNYFFMLYLNKASVEIWAGGRVKHTAVLLSVSVLPLFADH